MPSEAPSHCAECRFEIAKVFYDLDNAGRKLVDEKKVKEEVDFHRRHDIKSEAHFHTAGLRCNERCIA